MLQCAACCQCALEERISRVGAIRSPARALAARGGGKPMAAAAEPRRRRPPLRLLCLHGRTQTGGVFRSKLAPTMRRLRGVCGACRFPDAQGGDAGGGLQWWEGEGGAQRGVDDALRELERYCRCVPDGGLPTFASALLAEPRT